MEQYCNEIRLEGLGKEPAAKRILRGTVRATGSGCEIHLRLPSLAPLSVSSDLLCLTNSVPQELKEVGKEQPKVEAELPANVSKNRYPHVLPCKCCFLPPAPRGEPRSGTGPSWAPRGNRACPRALGSAVIAAPWGGERPAEHRALLLGPYMGLEELLGLLMGCKPDEIAAVKGCQGSQTCVLSFR